MRGPIFIGGSSRSGKTLVRWALSAHSRLAISRRTDLWPLHFGLYGDLSQAMNLERCLEAMWARPKVAALQLDVDRFKVALPAGDAGYARLFALMHEQFAARQGKVRWGDQTATIGMFTDQITAAYPGARFVHLIRDPRDCYEALTARAPLRRGGRARAIAAWCRAAELARRNAARYPDTYRVVHFETLVADPVGTLRTLCEFIDESYEPAMARLEGATRYDAERTAAADGCPFSSSYVGRYRDRVADHELAHIQRQAAGPMAAFGYPPDPIRLSSPARLRYAAAVPMNLAATACPPRGARADRAGVP